MISVVVFGLWGNFTSKWGMLSTAEESGSFDACEFKLLLQFHGLAVNALGGGAGAYGHQRPALGACECVELG